MLSKTLALAALLCAGHVVAQTNNPGGGSGGSGTVTSGTAGQATCYNATGTTVGPCSPSPATAAAVGADPTGAATSALAVQSPTALYTTGDSITAGLYVTPASAAYTFVLATALGLSGSQIGTRGTSGAFVSDVASQQIFPYDAPTSAPNQTMRTILVSTNDLDSQGVGAYEATFNKLLQGIIVSDTTPPQNKVMGSAATTTGTCATDTTYGSNPGINCTSSGATATFTLTTAMPGTVIYLLPRYVNGDAGTWTYAVDGGTAVAQTTALATAIAGQSATYAPGLIRVAGLTSSTTHTVVFTKTNASGNMPIVEVASPAGVTNTYPYLLVGDTPQQLNGQNQAAVNAYRADIAGDVALLAGDGLLARLAPVSKFLQATTAAGDMCSDGTCPGNTLHPNAIGDLEIANAFMSAVRFTDTGIPFLTGGTLPNAITYTSFLYGNGPTTVTTADQFPTFQTSVAVQAIGKGLNFFSTGNGSGGQAAGMVVEQPTSGRYVLRMYQPNAYFDGYEGCAYSLANPMASPAACAVLWGINGQGMFQETLSTPASSSATCTAGQFTADANFYYQCVATNTWKRAALSAF